MKEIYLNQLREIEKLHADKWITSSHKTMLMMMVIFNDYIDAEGPKAMDYDHQRNKAIIAKSELDKELKS